MSPKKLVTGHVAMVRINNFAAQLLIFSMKHITRLYYFHIVLCGFAS